MSGAATGSAPATTPAAGELQLSVRERVADPPDVLRLWLGHRDDQPLPPWQPGAHIAFTFDLPGRDITVRYYSLTGDHTDRSRYQVAVRLDRRGSGGSQWIHDHLHVGTQVWIRLPRNNFPMHQAQRYVFVAGGIGITPLLAMAVAADRAAAPWEMLYGARCRAAMAFLPELRELAAGSSVGRVRLLPEDETGLLPLAELADPRPGTRIYCCGPEALLDALEDETHAWPRGTVHVERYAPRRTPRRQQP